MSQQAGWTLAEVIDLEHFLNSGTPATLVTPATGVAPTASADPRQRRRAALLAWVRAQQAASRNATPGQAFAAGLRAVGAVATLTGLLAGAALAGGWLAHSGTTPVNAPLFWVMTVGWQLALAVATGKSNAGVAAHCRCAPRVRLQQHIHATAPPHVLSFAARGARVQV